ncbi:MAG: hypothetical protein ABSB36_02490 [Candidatus Dormibacteria bacterium]|jgi:rubredoxin
MRCPRCGSEKLVAIINADVQVPVEGPDRLHLSTTGVGSVNFMDDPRSLVCPECGWEEEGEVGFTHFRHQVEVGFALT